MAFEDDPEEVRKSFEQPSRAKHLDTHLWDDFYETNPDRKRARGGWACDASDHEIRAVLDVRKEGQRVGAMVLRCEGDPTTGRLSFSGMSIFTNAQIERGW